MPFDSANQARYFRRSPHYRVSVRTFLLFGIESFSAGGADELTACSTFETVHVYFAQTTHLELVFPHHFVFSRAELRLFVDPDNWIVDLPAHLENWVGGFVMNHGTSWFGVSSSSKACLTDEMRAVLKGNECLVGVMSRAMGAFSWLGFEGRLLLLADRTHYWLSSIITVLSEEKHSNELEKSCIWLWGSRVFHQHHNCNKTEETL